MSTCGQWRLALLEGAHAPGLAAHVVTCAQCRALRDRLDVIERLAAELTVPPVPAGLVASLRRNHPLRQARAAVLQPASETVIPRQSDAAQSMAKAVTIQARGARAGVTSTDRAIFIAGAELIAERGHDGFSMAAVANRAGVPKATVYRRWPTRSHLIMDIVLSLTPESIFDSGDLRVDLTSLARTLAAGLRTPGARGLVVELAKASAEQPDLAEALSRLCAPRRAMLANLRRAPANGEMNGSLDPDMLIGLLAGALHPRLQLDPGATAHVVEDVRTRQAVEALTERESEVMRLLAEGMTNREIARHLRISVVTVGTHLSRIFAKLGARSRVQAVLQAMRMGLLDVDANIG